MADILTLTFPARNKRCIANKRNIINDGLMDSKRDFFRRLPKLDKTERIPPPENSRRREKNSFL